MLKSAVVTGKLDLQVSTIKADDQCNFGRWLYGPTITAQQKNSSRYKAVRELHAIFHEKASKVAGLAVSGDKGLAMEMLEVNGEFSIASAALTTAMMAWLDEAE